MRDDVIIFCVECGCELLQKEDIGYEYTEKEYRRDYPMLKSSNVEVISKPFVVCKDCSDETERLWKEFKETPEGKYECEFMKWANNQINSQEQTKG